MIVIISNNSDLSTSNVIDWLLFYKKKFIRINETDAITACSICIENQSVDIVLNINGENVNLSTIDSFWFRRGRLRLNFPLSLKNTNIDQNGLNSYFNRENNAIHDFIIFSMLQKKILGNYHQANSNKLIALMKAKAVGLEIPTTHIDTSKKGIAKFFHQFKSCITKDIQDTLYYEYGNKKYYTMTSQVQTKHIEQMEESFFPSLLQENLEKRYELRIFFLKGEFYSMAIFSQQDKQTSIDYRNYNEIKPNRMVPYILPQKIKNQLNLFMNNMDLDTGSIDMIVTQDFRYVFLEVNPVGQYDMVSYPCNYYLHEKIAKII